MTQQTNTAGVSMDRLVYQAQQTIARAEMLTERNEMLFMGISRDDMPYKPNPWQHMRPLDDGLGVFRGLVNILIVYAAIGSVAASWYCLAHWHVWSKMAAIIAAWRWF